LHCRLFPNSIFLSNPGKAKKFAQSLGLVHKTDKSDAAMLAKYGSIQLDNVALWIPEDDDVRAIKTLICRLNALEKDKLRENNRLEANIISDAAERVIKSTVYLISVLDSEITDIQNEIDKLISSNPEMNKNRELLLSVIGIGKVMARELVYLFLAKKFTSAKQVQLTWG
jgi:transposase